MGEKKRKFNEVGFDSGSNHQFVGYSSLSGEMFYTIEKKLCTKSLILRFVVTTSLSKET